MRRVTKSLGGIIYVHISYLLDDVDKLSVIRTFSYVSVIYYKIYTTTTSSLTLHCIII